MRQIAGKSDTSELCNRCEKEASLCPCAVIEPVPSSTQVLILQHPQEPDKRLGSARIAHLALKNSEMKIGLSWANLEKALGKSTDRSGWAVLYLGSSKLSPNYTGDLPALFACGKDKSLRALEKDEIKSIRGIVVLDGTWSQAKALWWRNAWLTKLRRLVLIPNKASLYGKLRKEPRKEGLSTIESIALTLSLLEKNAELPEKLLKPFKALLRNAGAKIEV